MTISKEDVLTLLNKNQTKIAYATKLKKAELNAKLCDYAIEQNQIPIEACWLILNETVPNKCIICDKKARFDSMSKGYQETCSNECGYELKKRKSKIKLQAAWDNKREEILEKRAQTCFNRFGVEHALQSEEVKSKGRNTCMENYGVDHPLKTREIQNQSKQTKLRLYGSFSEIGKRGNAQRNATNQIRYGVDNVSQYSPIRDKMSLSAIGRIQKGIFKRKVYVFPSGREDLIQGYEPFVLDLLLSEGVNEDDILTTRNCPVIKYEDRRYLPDIYIKSKNLLIEVKCNYTLKADFERNIKKQKAAIAAGFLHEIWVMDYKGRLISKQ